MKAVLWQRGDHLPEVKAWTAARGMAWPEDDEWLPDTGWIVPGVAACWLYLTNSSLAYADGLISNPKVSHVAVVRALDAILTEGSDYAKARGWSTLVCVAPPSLKRGLLRRGWVDSGATGAYLLKRIAP